VDLPAEQAAGRLALDDLVLRDLVPLRRRCQSGQRERAGQERPEHGYERASHFDTSVVVFPQVPATMVREGARRFNGAALSEPGQDLA
jgi:hypothetical protein